MFSVSLEAAVIMFMICGSNCCFLYVIYYGI